MHVERLLFLASWALSGFGFRRIGSVADPPYLIGGDILSVLKNGCVDMFKSVSFPRLVIVVLEDHEDVDEGKVEDTYRMGSII